MGITLGEASEYKKPACKTGFFALSSGKDGIDRLLLGVTYESACVDGQDVYRAVFSFGHDFV